MTEYSMLRVEEDGPTDEPRVADPHAKTRVPRSEASTRAQPDHETDWRAQAIALSQEASNMRAHLSDVQKSADELRARLGKTKSQLDRAHEKNTQLQAAQVALMAERDDLREQVRGLGDAKRHAWDLFVSLPNPAGGE